MNLPLKGLRVLTVEQFGAGPYGSMFLADLGAEVIKLEAPGRGDASRQVGPHELGEADSQYFQTFNLNKRSLTLDLKSARGQAVLHRLVAGADALLNNLKGDQPEKLGLSYPALRAHNPRLVCAHLSAYGRDNARTAWPGFDYLMQAEAGFMGLTGEPDSPPARFGLSIIDFMTGITCALGLLAAVMAAREHGEGRDVDVSLFDVALHQLSYPATWYLNAGEVTGRLPRSAHPSTVPTQLFPTADGWIFVMCMLERFWQELIQAMGREDLAARPEFTDMAARRTHRDALTEVLDAEFRKRTTAEWLEALQGRLPVGPVLDLPQALDNAFVREVGMLQDVAHPLAGSLRTLRNPIRLDGERLSGEACPPLGADSEALLNEAGFTAEDIRALREDGII